MHTEAAILIVDDDAAIRKVLKYVVELSGGYSTQAVGTAREALDIAGQNSFQVALLDLTLPDMDGLELLRRMRESSQLTEFIILSGHASADKEAEVVSAGAFAYLAKPSSPKELLSAIEGALKKQGMLSAES